MLSSGTQEILMVRSAQVDTSLLCDYSGSTCELDSQPGRYNPGMQWLASGVLSGCANCCGALTPHGRR